MTPIRRVPGGTSKGGQFSAVERQEAPLSVGGAPSLPDVGPAGPDEIRALAASPDPLIRAEVTSSLRVPDDVLEELAEPDQPTAVRLAAAATGYAGTADRAAEDRNPIVRAVALHSGVLSETKRSRLENDPKVIEVIGLIAQ